MINTVVQLVLVLGSLEPIICHDVWWKNTIIYEIYPQSFYDSNNDGLGDLRGVEMKAQYLSELGIGAVWLNPFYQSPLKDNGYDISDYRKINPIFGTMQDFERMLNTLKYGYGIKVIVDFVPNHTSDQHEWFQKSIKRIDPYTDYYLWKDPKGWENGKPIPPNNWESIFEPNKPGSSWEWNDERKQFYFHAFMREQPDLDFRNKKVIEEMKDILRFWLDKGVEGFRVDAIPHLVEDEQFRDNPPYSTIYTQNLDGTYEIIQDFRAFLDCYGERNDVDIFLTTEGYAGPEATLRYYGDTEKPGAHFPFNFLLLTKLEKGTDAYSLNDTLSSYLSEMKDNRWPNWVSGNHDWPRIPSRLGATSAADVLNMLNLLLPGTATTYMGDELGMDSYWNMDKSGVPENLANDYRSPGRTPFHWSNNIYAGFTKSHKPWLPINVEYYRCNVETLENEDHSSLNVYKALVNLKKTDVFREGKTEFYVPSKWVLAFTRELHDSCYVVLLNLGIGFTGPVNIFEAIPKLKNYDCMDIEVKSVNMEGICTDAWECEKEMEQNKFYLPPKSGIVFSMEGNSRRK